MRTVAKEQGRHKTALLTEDLEAAILARYLAHHGPASEARLAAVVRSARDAALHLCLFTMVMQGRVIPARDGEDLRYSASPESQSLEPIGPILRRILAEVAA
jgi:hypothetical protein